MVEATNKVQATVAYFTSPSSRVLPTPSAKQKPALVSPLPLKVTEPQVPELIKPKDGLKLPIKRTISTNSLSEHGTNGTATSMTSPTSTEKPPPPPQANGQPTNKSDGLPVPPKESHPRKKLRPPPRPNPAASLFIPSKKVCLSPPLSAHINDLTEATPRCRLGGTEQETTLDYEYTLVFPCSFALQLVSVRARYTIPRKYLPCIIPHIRT